MFITALVVGILGGVNLRFNTAKNNVGKYLFGWGLQAVIATLLSWWILFVNMPSFASPLWGWNGFLVVIFMFVFGVIAVAASIDESHDEKTSPGVLAIPIALVALFGIRGCAGDAIFTSAQKVALLGDVEERKWTDDLAPVSDLHIRMVSEDQAEWYGNKSMGEEGAALGSRYKPGKYSIQRVGDHLLWVAPLEFTSFSAWQGSRTVPGYVVMSAEDPHQQAKLVTKIGERDIKMKYMPESYFGDNLDRYLFENGYSDVYLHDYHFELDDSYNPHWVVSITVPTAGYENLQVKEVLIVNAETGEITRYDVDKVPAWVDRVFPADLVAQRINDWGSYQGGWINSWWGSNGLIEAASSDLPIVWEEHGSASYFTGLTSQSKHDNSLVGLMLVNTRTGAAREYKLSGTDENGVIQAVHTAISNYPGWTPTQPVLHNIYGRLAWVVPVVSSGIFQSVAIVDAENSQVFLGATKEKALAEFRKGFSGTGNSIAPSALAKMNTVSMRIDRVQADGQTGQYILWSASYPAKVFVGTLANGYAVPLTRAGDTVTISFVDTSDSTVAINKLDNAAVPLK